MITIAVAERDAVPGQDDVSTESREGPPSVGSDDEGSEGSTQQNYARSRSDVQRDAERTSRTLHDSGHHDDRSSGNTDLAKGLGSVLPAESSPDSLSEHQSEPLQNAGFEELCLSLGMKAEAAAGWRGLCKNPYVVFFGYFISVFVFQTMSLIFMLGKDPITSWYSIVPHTVLAAVWMVYVPRMWLYGPSSAASKINDILTLPHILCTTFIGFSISVGPRSWVPYNRRAVSMVIVGLFLAFQNGAAHSGSVPTFHPPEPHKSMVVPYRNGTLDAVCMVDMMAEAFILRMLIEQASGDCLWFGEPGNCTNFIVLLVAMTSLLAFKFTKMMLFFFFRAWLKTDAHSNQVAYLGGHGVAMCCDLGIAVVELLNIFSFAANPPGSSATFSDRSEFSQELALSILSVVFAVFSFGISVAGFRGVWKKMQATAAKAHGMPDNDAPICACFECLCMA